MEAHLARQFESRVARAKTPKVCQDRDTVHLGVGKRWTAIPRFELAIVLSLCRISVKRIAKNKTVPLCPAPVVRWATVEPYQVSQFQRAAIVSLQSY